MIGSLFLFICFVVRDPGRSHTHSEAGDDSEHPVFPPLVLSSWTLLVCVTLPSKSYLILLC